MSLVSLEKYKGYGMVSLEPLMSLYIAYLEVDSGERRKTLKLLSVL